MERRKQLVSIVFLAAVLVLSPAGWATEFFSVFDLTEENALQSNDVKDVFIYDVTKDSTDYTTWYDDSSKSWWQQIREPHNLILWSELGSEQEITNSEIGPDGLIVGTINYLPGKFGNGFKPEVRTGDRNIPDNYIRFDGLNLGQKGCIEFWYQPDWVSGGHIRHILSFARPDGYSLILVHYNDWQNKLHFAVWNSSDYDYVNKYIIPASTPEWSTTEPFHVAIVWDGTAANNADKVKLYLNGNERGTLVSRGSPTFADWGSGNHFWLATRYAPGDWDRHHWEGTDGIMDNIKVWDYAKTDFDDRFVEYSGDVRGQFPTKSYLVCTDLGLDIVDSDSNQLWMRFKEGTGNALQSTVHNAVKALDGKVFVGSDTGLYEINFVDDVIIRTDSNGIAYYNGNISERNDGKGYGAVSGTGIVNTAVNGIALTTNYVFVGTDGGVSLIDLSSGAVYDDSGNACYAVYITDSGELIYHDYDELLRKNSLPGSDFSADDSTYLTGINSIVAGHDEIFVGVEGGGVVVVDSTTFNVSQQSVKSGFDDSQSHFWNRMENVVGNTFLSEVGTDLTLAYTNYNLLDAMFEKGFDNTHENSYLYANSNDIIASSQQGAVEWWWVPDDDADTTLGGWGQGPWNKCSVFFSNAASPYPVNDRWYFEMWYCHFASPPIFTGYFSKSDSSGGYHACWLAPPFEYLTGNWKAGDRVHFAFAWHNENVILGKYICAFWVNGELLYGVTEPNYGTLEGWRTTNPTTPYDPTMRIGDSRFGYTADEQLRGPMDNVKTYDFAKDDWGDKHLENGSVVKVFAGESGNVRALALGDDSTTLYVGTNDGNDGGGISVIDTAISGLIYNWTLGENEELVDYDITSLSFWRHPDNVSAWNLLIGTEDGASVITHYNTPVGTDVTVIATDPATGEPTAVTVTFSEVTAPGNTTATASSTGPAPPLGFKLGKPPVYYDINTDATYVGPVTVCISYDETQFKGREENLTLLHKEDGWLDCTLSLDTVEDVICGEVSSISLFVIAIAPVEATIDIDPDTLNLKSKGKFVTCYIELPEGYMVEDIEIDSVALAKINDDLLDPRLYTVGPSEIGDYDDDGISDLMVKFDWQELIEVLEPGEQIITLTGQLTDGTPLAGIDVILAIH